MRAETLVPDACAVTGPGRSSRTSGLAAASFAHRCWIVAESAHRFGFAQKLAAVVLVADGAVDSPGSAVVFLGLMFVDLLLAFHQPARIVHLAVVDSALAGRFVCRKTTPERRFDFVAVTLGSDSENCLRMIALGWMIA